jgi:hypothetical protein
LRPQAERNCRYIVYDGHGVTVPREVDGSQEMLAAFATFYADMWKLLGNIHRKFLLLFLSAMSTKNSPKFPLLRTECTLQKPLSAIPFRSQHAKQGKGIAPGTPANRHRQSRREQSTGKKLGVRL